MSNIIDFISKYPFLATLWVDCLAFIREEKPLIDKKLQEKLGQYIRWLERENAPSKEKEASSSEKVETAEKVSVPSLSDLSAAALRRYSFLHSPAKVNDCLPPSVFEGHSQLEKTFKP